MSAGQVAQGRLVTPFYARQRELDTLNRWHEWQGYTVADALYCEELEYFAIRNATGVFDLTPMTKYRITGPDATAYLDRLVTRDMRLVGPGRVAYVVWCNDAGQVIDDGTVFHLAENDYRLCSQERHFDWLLAAAAGFDVEIAHETAEVAALAVQGPTSFSTFERMGLGAIGGLKPFDLMRLEYGGASIVVSRTGFTGDLGYEVWLPPAVAEAFWDDLFAAGALTGIRAIGGEALELARIEAGYLTAGVDFLPADQAVRPGRTRSPLELGMEWMVDFGKPNFNGRRALAEEWRKGSRWRLVRLDIEGNKPAVDAHIHAKRGAGEIGFVTSAAWSPVCKQNIALATVDARYGRPGDVLWVDIYYRREMHWRREMARAKVVEGPFWDPPRRRATPPGPY
ncbi:MAG: aminomethyltransferase family protein [Pseudomonadota bacterium]